ncbi:hypothetical protein F2Q69_00034766 [Brassica cretica]|uniref:Uncharacterized protein n=1 Tax=Brassica cretica TaxID=69181 RepID=A0A8S9SSY2_BRACR|nr:hypothetical protein F2Q69_00034766 [Brassica cretica]
MHSCSERKMILWLMCLIFFLSYPILIASSPAKHMCHADQSDALWEFKSEFHLNGMTASEKTRVFYGSFNQLAVPKRKGGRLVGLACRASSYPAFSSQAPYANPMILEELHDKDERIGVLEEQNTTILSENATIRSENATILAELASQKKFNTEIMQKLDRLMSSSSS